MKQKVKVKIKVNTKSKKSNPWRVHLKKVYTKMKAKDKSTRLGDAMKKAKTTYKKKK